MQPVRDEISDNWQKLVALLHELPANGPGGFEGLIALILEGITAKPFFVAATGRQPTGDAVSVDARISVQAKRYGPQTALDWSKVAADFISVCNAANERLDVYVVAVTRESAQLRRELEPFERRTGVDIVVLADEPGRPELSALCVAFWPRLQAFFPGIPAPLASWITGVTNDPLVLTAVERTKAKVGVCLNTFLDLQSLARARLAMNFRSTRATTSSAGGHIVLSDAVERKSPHTSLLAWWQQTKEACAYLEAQEGCGKSWVAAAFAEQLAGTTEAPAVLWLESLDWAGCTTLEGVVTAALRTVLPAGDQRADLFVDKIFRLWPRPVLLVLDGVNEHGCLEAAQRLLRLYGKHDAHYVSHLRLLFTTRPLKTYTGSGYWPDAWEGSRRIPLNGFTGPEFDEALRRFAPDVVPASVPANVREFAAVPRFFRIALRLKERLRDLGQLTKPLLLFADLIDKIEHDPRVERLFAATAEATLAHLAQHSRPSDAGGTTVSHEHLRECFPNFPQALDDLAEQRIVLGRLVGNVVVNQDHVVLGFALCLLQLAEKNPGASEATLRDQFAAVLEPNREDDSRTEALYVALLLSLLRDPPTGHTWLNARRALMILWCGGHNARRTADRLSFWARVDLAAYRRVVESLFTRYLSGSQDTELIAPIARQWRDVGSAEAAVTQLLSDWLTLVFPTVDTDDSTDEAKVRAGFPHAETHQQLRLTFAAISILSLRPEDAMLPVVVRCARSCSLCRAQDETNGKVHDVRLKTPYENLGVLLRWNYTDTVVPKLVALAEATGPDRESRSGLWTLGECLDLVSIPLALRRPEPPHIREVRDDSSATVVEKFRAWIHDLPSAQSHWPHIWRLELLADHPAAELDARDLAKLHKDLSRVLTETTGQQVGRDTVADIFPHVFPWLARFAPAIAQHLSGEYWHYVLRSTNPAGAAMVAPLLPLPPEVLAKLVDEARLAVNRLKDANVGYFLTRLSKVFLLSHDESIILNWFEVMLALPVTIDGEEWRVLPVPYMIEQITTPSLAAACWVRFEGAAQEFPDQPADRRVLYWLRLLTTLVRNDAAAGRKALGLARTLASNHPWVPELLEIVAASNDSAVVEVALLDAAFRRHLENAKATHHFAWFLRLPAGTQLSPSVRQLIPALPPTVAAELLRWTNGEHEHLSFAQLLAESAMRRATNPSIIAEPGYELSWTRAHDDHRAWWHIDEAPAGSRTHHSDLSAVWGVDRGQLSDWGAAFGDDDGAALRERNRQMHEAAKRSWGKLKAVADQYLLRFRAQRSLDHWARHAPDDFRRFAAEFFTTLAKHPGGYFELSLFCDDVLGTLCLIDAGEAVRLHDDFFGNARGVVRIDGMIPSFLNRVMASDLNGQAAMIAPLRLRLIERSRSDRDVLGLVMAAIHGKTLPWLRQQARAQFGTSPLAKERAMAVSILAFAEAAEDREWLSALAYTDPSDWVRDHAKWALRVHDQCSAARRLWDEAVTEVQSPTGDLLLIANRLTRLHAILLPTAIYWDKPKGPLPTVNALVTAFWYSWHHQSERDLCGRKLAEYYCGEKLGDVTKRMAPWWNADA